MDQSTGGSSGEGTLSGVADQIEAHVLSRVGGRIRNLRVLIRQDGLVLAGQAPTYHVKQLAQHVAMEVSGLAVAANDIEVR